MSNVASPTTLQHAIPSYLPADNLGPWGIYLQQVDRVTPYLDRKSTRLNSSHT